MEMQGTLESDAAGHGQGASLPSCSNTMVDFNTHYQHSLLQDMGRMPEAYIAGALFPALIIAILCFNVKE